MNSANANGRGKAGHDKYQSHRIILARVCAESCIAHLLLKHVLKEDLVIPASSVSAIMGMDSLSRGVVLLNGGTRFLEPWLEIGDVCREVCRFGIRYLSLYV